MKIGILTFHRPINYGAFLQCYSLVNGLQKEYPNSQVKVIDYIAPKEKHKIIINLLRTFKHSGLVNTIKEIRLIKQFRKSLKKLPLTNKKICSNDLDKLFKYIDENFDFLIIGSDAVFNWNQNGYPSAFLPNYVFKKCKVVSYAASVHGLKYYEQPKNRIEELSKIFLNYKIIGVRDYNTEQFVKYASKKSVPIHCCDPTFFINCEDALNNARDFKSRINKKYKIDLSKKYIVIMLADGEISNSIYEEYKSDYLIISLFKKSKYSDVYLYDLNPFEWMAVLSDASLIITSYFHGTLLALKQNTPVITIDCSNYNDLKYESKLKDLYYRRLKITDLYFDFNNYDIDMKHEILKVSKQALNGKYNKIIKTSVENESKEFETFIKLFKEIMRNNDKDDSNE